MAKPTLEHTDIKNSIYEKHFRNCINELKQGVNQPDYREKEIEKIHKLWNKFYKNIQLNVVQEMHFKNNDLKRICIFFKHLLDSLDTNKILKLKRLNEGVIDTFYNMMLSSRVIAEAEDNFKVAYNYSDEKTLSKDIIELSMNNIFSEYMTWEQFKKIIDIKNINLDDEKTKLIWSLILLKENISDDDIKNIIPAEYNFAEKYTSVIAEYWLHEFYNKKDISISEWIIVMQELMCIYHNKIQYKNSFIRHTNPKSALTAAIKNFKTASELPKQIILNRLINRSLLMFGTKELLEDKIQIDKYIMQLEKIIFSYKNIEDIKAAHSYLYFHTTAILTTKFENFVTLNKFKQTTSRMLIDMNIPKITIIPNNDNIYFYTLMISILCADKSYHIVNNKEFLKLREEGLKYLNQVKTLSLEDENLKKAIEIDKLITPSKTALNILIQEFAEEIKRLYASLLNYNLSRIFSIPIYLGKENEYYLYFRFALYIDSNTIDIPYIKFIGKDITQPDIYQQLLLNDNYYINVP